MITEQGAEPDRGPVGPLRVSFSFAPSITNDKFYGIIERHINLLRG